MNLRTASPILATLGLAIAGPAAAAIVGDAANYNVFVFGSGSFVSQNTDTMGDLAVGGDVSLMNYSVAAGVAGDRSQTPNPAQLVVGGKLTAQNGGVGSNQAGTIYTNTAPSLTSFTATGGVKAQTLISSFSADATQYTNLASNLGTLTANGTTSSGSGNTLSFTGTVAGLNVFKVSGTQLANSQTINISAPTGSTVLIDVSGTSATFQNGSVNESGVGAASVFFNLYQATSVSLVGSKDPEGSILAPLAGVTGGFGAMHGQLIAGSYTGNTQFDSVQFTGNLTPVPLPAPVWLLGSALAGWLWLARRRASARFWLDFPAMGAAGH
jgi:choice-of-anchor A domain-containing protein